MRARYATFIAAVVFAAPLVAAAAQGLDQYAPAITPQYFARVYPAGSTQSVTYTVRNAGTQTATYAISLTCGSWACHADQSSVSLAPNATTPVTVTFTT